ncbi:hypothetical protein [Pararhizobium mangrovi]|uniref:Uncharacterized protein n=1 Tax=Pararhizobium mangrovi TaxID=2590452 RepID=A0A506U670_9HYPH|nr:hypothetical protein [Pararhizobium mangrovi]TPW27417.1 hypothetical protein FJU11_11660 [Pararhizobium mangrovi]
MSTIGETPKRGFEPADVLSGLKRRGDMLQRISALATLVLLIIAFSFMNDAFFSMRNGMSVLLQTAVIGPLGIGVTVVISLVCHDMHDVFRLCDRVMVMNNSRSVGEHAID